MEISGNPMSTNRMIHEIRLMIDSGGALTFERKILLAQVADRLEDLDERVAIMEEGNRRGKEVEKD